MHRIMAVVVAIVTLLGACASAPEPVPPPDDAYDTAEELRTQIQEYDLAQYAQDGFDLGEQQFASGEVAYENEEYSVAEEAFNLAIDRYTDVIREGFRAIAGARREEATAEKERADELKAGVAVPDAYEAAQAVYNEAIDEASDGNDRQAAELFENAAFLFAEAYQQSDEKRQQALDAMNRVDQRVQDLDVQRETLEEAAREDLDEDETDEEN
ncbi:MAG: hypothetical protein ACOCW3_06470 [Spirochaetota bacterium]